MLDEVENRSISGFHVTEDCFPLKSSSCARMSSIGRNCKCRCGWDAPLSGPELKNANNLRLSSCCCC